MREPVVVRIPEELVGLVAIVVRADVPALAADLEAAIARIAELEAEADKFGPVYAECADDFCTVCGEHCAIHDATDHRFTNPTDEMP